MTYQGDSPPEVPDEYWDGPNDEPPYPEGINMAPLVIAVTIILTVLCWWLAYNAPNLGNALLFGFAPVLFWCIGLRIIRGSKKRAEAGEPYRLQSMAYEQHLPHHINKLLLPGEPVLFVVHRHPITMLGKKHPWVGGLLALVWAGVAAGMLHAGQPAVAGGMLLVLLMVALVRWVLWRDEWFWKTSKRFMRRHGLVREHTSMVANAKITNVDVTISAPAMALAWLRFIWVPWGHISIQAADSGEGDKHKAKGGSKASRRPRWRRKSKPAPKKPQHRHLFWRSKSTHKGESKRKPPTQIRYLPSATALASMMLHNTPAAGETDSGGYQ